MRYRLVTLGQPRLDIVASAGATRSIGPGKPLALITCLCLAQKRRETRDVLCDLLWGDRSPDHARPHLRQTLWLIKTQISDRLLSAQGDVVAIANCIQVDVHDFLHAIEHGDYSAAVDLYSGDFFSGYAAPGAAQFEEWANLERTRLRGRFISAAETLARRALDAGHFSEAIQLASRMRSADPNGQAAWRLLIESRLASGDMIGVRADADQFEDWLRREEWEAESESVAVIRLARRSTPSPSEDTADDLTAELVGREREFSVVQEAWRSVESNKARLVHITGESGLGKTRLTRDIIARIRAGRGRARYLKANYGERGLPFSFVSSIAQELSSLPGARGIAPAVARTLISLNPALSSIYPETPTSSEQLQPLRVGLALLDLISSVADEKPIAIALDDMHWADQQSREALAVVASRLNTHHVLLITAGRPVYVAPQSRDDSVHILLSRLSETDVALLVTSLAELPDEDWTRSLSPALHKSSSGNPLAILETLRYGIDAGILSRENGRWHCTDPAALARTLEDRTVTDSRLAGLEDRARTILLIVCVAGMPISSKTVADSLAMTSGEFQGIASELELRGMIITDHGMCVPAHDAIAEALLSGTAQREITEAHALLGEVMSRDQDGASQKRAVSHFVAAGNWTAASELIIPILRRTARNFSDVHNAVGAIVGDGAGADSVRIIEKSLPLFVRFPRLRLQLAVATVAIAATTALMGYASRAEVSGVSGPELVLFATSSDGGTDIRTAPLDRSRWNPGRRLPYVSSRHLKEWIGDGLYHAPSRPGATQWAVYHIYPDSGEGDIDLIDAGGKRTRVVSSRGDDRPGSFSPDGRHLLFLSTRWSSRGWSDVAIIDLSTGVVTRVSQPGWKYNGPVWSTDGTRIAYLRHNYAGDVQQLCIADANGAHARCDTIDGWKIRSSTGWIDSRHLVLAVTGPHDNPAIVIYDVNERSIKSSDFLPTSEMILDPTGAWALTKAPDDPMRGARVSPSTQYVAASAVPEADGELKAVTFSLPELGDQYVDRIRISHPTVPLVPDIPYQLRLSAWSRKGHELAAAVTRWRSLTPAIASIDSLGVIVPLQLGSAIVEASAGGWRTTVDTIRVQEQRPVMVLDEHWKGEVLARWNFFGRPTPLVVDDGNAKRFLNNGDGNFFSGAYLTRGLDARVGLAMDVELNTPISEFQWQMISLLLEPFSARAELDRWDHVTGYITDRLDHIVGCGFTYPTGEGRGALTPPWFKSWRRAVGDSSYALHNGSWYKVRVQIFPDGRCGVAINGHPVLVNIENGPVRLPVLPMIYGSTVGTRILVGRVVINTGVPRDIDWSKLEFDGQAWVHRGAH